MKEKVFAFKEKSKKELESRFGDLYGLEDLVLMDDGMGTVEVILIIVVLIGLVLIFKKQIRSVVENVMNKITADSESVMS